MKTKQLILFMCLAFFLSGMTSLSAQVTIGSNLVPVDGALLDLKEHIEDEPEGSLVTASSGGLLMPRVKLKKRKELNPLVPGATTEVKLLHTGLVVYNLQEVESEDLQVGLNYWDGEKWNSLIIKEEGQSEFSILNCEAITIDGHYQIGTPLGAGNVMKMKVSVSKKGTYTIIAQADPFNGYYFFADGEFKSTGTFEIVLNGAGTPITPKENPLYDLIVIDANGKRVSCTRKLEIEDSAARPRYALSCNSVTVNGIYRKGVALDNTNTISLVIDVEAGTEGAAYHVYTDEVDGIKFEGRGVLSGGGSANITLYGTGMPTDFEPKTFTITSNSESSSATCSVAIQPVIVQKKIVNFGAKTWGVTGGSSGIGCGTMIEDVMNYGNNVNSIVKYEGFTNITVETRINDINVKKYTGEDGVNQPYDIIIITHNLRPTSDVQLNALINYVNKGGVLIVLDQDKTSTGYSVRLLAGIFNISNPKTVNIGTGTNQVPKLTYVDDEILNGPFGDIRGLQIGDDNADTAGIVTDLPADAIIYADGINAHTNSQGTGNAADVKALLLRHRTKNFFWSGDGGLIASSTSTGSRSYPFKLGPYTNTSLGVTYPYYPVAKPDYGYGSASLPVYNSVLFANVMAWALRMAEENGINTP